GAGAGGMLLHHRRGRAGTEAGARAPSDAPARGAKTGGAGRGDRGENDADRSGSAFPPVESILAILLPGPLPPQLLRGFRRGAPLPTGNRQRPEPVGVVSQGRERGSPAP